MPELVAEIEQPPPIVAGKRPIVMPEVGNVVHQRIEPLFVRLGDVAAGGILDLAEIAGEGDLLLVGDILIVKDEHGVTIHPPVDCRDTVARQRLPQIDTRHLADKDRVDLTNGNSHRGELLKQPL
jgi:hypothetical protein